MARQTSHVIVQPTAPGPQKPARPRDPVASGERDAAHNRVASHNYFLLEKFEAGVALRGTEVKSIREGKANLRDSYGLIQNAALCRTGPEVAEAKARRFIELPSVSAGPRMGVDPCGPPWRPWTQFLTQLLTQFRLAVMPIQQCLILSKLR